MFLDRIIVVDDDPQMISSIKRILNEYEILGFQNGEDAINYLKKLNEVNLVLLDVFMRGMDGMSVLSEIKKIDKDKPVIIMTAYGSMDLAIQALRYHADDFIEKPLDINELKDRVRKLLKEKFYMNKYTMSNMDKIDRVKRFVQKNYSNISLGCIADEMRLSTKYISSMFKERNKSSFRYYKLSIRIDKAKALLEDSSYNVSQIAYQMGYQNPESFMRIFKKVTKYTPSQYRKKFQHKKRYKSSAKAV